MSFDLCRHIAQRAEIIQPQAFLLTWMTTGTETANDNAWRYAKGEYRD